tara:strand:+ start:956 stop:1864 length:909 start_codon:yes stop_codon:yes gene_type:complete
MQDINNSGDLALFVEQQKTLSRSMQSRDISTLPELNREQLIELGSVMSYDDSLATLKKQNTEFVWHVAMPKSGCTWVSKILQKGLAQRGWKSIYLIPDAQRREQQFSPIELLRQKKLDTPIFAAQQHCTYSEYAVDFIKKFNIKLIIQVRDIYDCIVSNIDHLDNESIVIPFAYLSQNQWNGFSYEQKLMFVVDFIVPWYISFWIGWTSGLQEHRIEYYLCQYENLNINPHDEFLNIAKYCDPNIKNEDVVQWLSSNTEPTRKNKAIVGRGRDLPKWVEKKIQQLISYYPDFDFTSIGIIRK